MTNPVYRFGTRLDVFEGRATQTTGGQTKKDMYADKFGCVRYITDMCMLPTIIEESDLSDNDDACVADVGTK